MNNQADIRALYHLLFGVGSFVVVGILLSTFLRWALGAGGMESMIFATTLELAALIAYTTRH